MHAARSSYEKAVCPSVKRVHCNETEKKFCPDVYTVYDRLFSLVLREEEWLVGLPLLHEIVSQTDPRWSEIACFQSIFPRSASAIAVAPSKKFN